MSKKKSASKISVIGKVTSASVEKATKKNWDEWIKILDTKGGRNLTHKEMVEFLAKKYKLIPWWQQWVTAGYETHIGRRIEGRNAKGEYSVTITKSIPVSQKELWAVLSSPEGIRIWLNPMSPFQLKLKAQFEVEGGIFGEVRTMKAPVRARLSWREDDGSKPTYVQIYIVSRPKNKSILAFSHTAIKTLHQRDTMREEWRAKVDALKILATK